MQFIQAKHYKRGRIQPVRLIVIHSMEAPEKGNTAENVARYFSTCPMPASAHFCIDNDSIVQSVKVGDTAYHCKGANASGLGLEHAGYAKQSEAEWLDEYGKAMLLRSAELTARLCKVYGVPVQRAKFAGPDDARVVMPGITGHVDVPEHGSHWDPGPHFPWLWYLDRVKESHDSLTEPVKPDWL